MQRRCDLFGSRNMTTLPKSPALRPGCKRSGGGEPDIVRHDQLLFLGDALMPGARPGLICSGVGTDFSSSTGSDAGVARSVVVAGMPETSGMPSGTLSIAMRTGTRCARRTQV